jgi:hypothetical protein
MLKRTGFLFCFLLALPAWTQSTAAAGDHKAVISNGGLLHSLFAAPVTDHPYSAIQVHSTQRVLADGTKISHEGHHFVARDAQGRVHVEVRMGNGKDGEADPAMVFVLDPVAHTLMTWVSGPESSRQASVLPLHAPSPGSQAAHPAGSHSEAGLPQPIVTVEDLGTDSLQGVPVSVQRTTTVVPAGRSGNDAPITKTDEMWLSRDMQLILKEQWTDPRTGVRTVELTHLSLDAPDPALFQPPRGYTIKTALESLQEVERKMAEAEK